MDSDTGSVISSPKIKQEDTDLQSFQTGRKKLTRNDAKGQKKRDLVRWDDDLDKQVLLTLQWACNEVGIKIPWDLVAKTLGETSGSAISAGAIVQHLAKLRNKMTQADIAVPPALRRNTVAKEPSKIYANNNGKKLPPPVFATPSTPVQTKAKKPGTPKSQATPKPKPKSKAKGKRRKSEFEDSDEEEINDYVEDSDEEYGMTKKKVRTTKAKAKDTKVNTSKSATKKAKTAKVELDTATAEEINEDILRTLGDGGPASRTRHVKQDFTELGNLSDEEEVEEEDTSAVEMPATFSPNEIKDEGSISPRTIVPEVNVNVAAWSQGVTPGMSPPENSTQIKGQDIVPAYLQRPLSNRNGLMTPQPSRQASTASLTTPLLDTLVPMNFGQHAGHDIGRNSFVQVAHGPQDTFSVNYPGASINPSVFQHGGPDLSMGFAGGNIHVNAPLPPSTGLDSGFDEFLRNESFFRTHY